ncbi:MAG: Uma2 family endonuclease [Beijerinckiaceae bacterium]|nr:Uma2 family endonuclease [Beijerinckiaceae bacterium]
MCRSWSDFSFSWAAAFCPVLAGKYAGSNTPRRLEQSSIAQKLALCAKSRAHLRGAGIRYHPRMGALPKIPVSMTVAEFLAWTPQSAQLWQLVDGEPRAMAPASRTHGAIQNELGQLIANALTESMSPCTVITAPGIIPHVQPDTNFRIPDLAVTCSGYVEEEAALTGPVLLIEILSPGNQAETWANVFAYATIPSVKEILVLKTANIGAELLRRAPDGTWPREPLYVETANLLTLESIGFSMPLADAYRTTRLAPKS